jgi:hypothetical protein
MPPLSNPEYPDIGFPWEQHEWEDTGCYDDAFMKVAMHHASITRHH